MGDVAKDLASGTIGGAAQLIVGHPFDTIKVKLQSQPVPLPEQPPKYAGAIVAVKKTVAVEGLGGLYKGMGAPLATVAALNALLFTVRGQLESLLRSEPGSRHVKFPERLQGMKQFIAGGQDTSGLGRGFMVIAGGVAGDAFWGAVYPTDGLKSALRVDDYRKSKFSGFKCSTNAFRKILARSQRAVQRIRSCHG